MAATPRLSITAIHNDVTFSKKDVVLWVKIPPSHYEFQNDIVREKFAENFSLALANILNSEETELDCQLIVTSKAFDTVKWRNEFLKQASYTKHTPYLNGFSAEMANQVWSYQFRDKSVYLGVKLGWRTDFSPKKNFFKIPAIDEAINRLTGDVDEYLEPKELEFWENRAKLVRYSLMESDLEAQRVKASEIAYILRKSMFPGMPTPSIEDLEITESQTWGAGELQTLADADVVNKPKWLEITQTINGKEYKGYRATLCFAKFPEVLRFPEREPWIHSASLLGFPVDIYSRFSIIPSKKVRKQVTNKIKAFQDQASNMTSAGGNVSLEIQENYQLGEYLEYALSKDDTPWLYGRHRITVEASSEEQLKERCQSVIDHYKGLGILVVWSTGDQLSLLLESMPNDRVRLNSYYQRHELGIIGAGVPAGAGGAGDIIESQPDGSTKGWLGPYLGYTTSRVVEPVFLSMHSGIARSTPPALVITGAPGSGKSFTAFNLTYNMVVSGVRTVLIDPKMDSIMLPGLPGCEDSSLVDLQNGHDGMLDPFLMGETEGEKIDLVMDCIIMFVGGLGNITSIAQAELSKAIKIVLRDRYPSMNKLTEILLASNTPDAAALGEKLSIIRKLPYARLCFSNPGRGKQIETLTLKNQLTVITLFGLEIPTSDTPKEDYSTRNRLAVAILFLLTSFTRSLLLSSSKGQQDLTPKSIVIDEAWAITSTAQGAKMVNEVARMGRSLNTALVLVSQNAGDFLGENVTNSVSTKMAFKTEDEKEINNVLQFFNLPIERRNQDVIRSLKRGECLLKDASGRIARVAIDGWSETRKVAFETNPESKRRNAEEKTRNLQ